MSEVHEHAGVLPYAVVSEQAATQEDSAGKIRVIVPYSRRWRATLVALTTATLALVLADHLWTAVRDFNNTPRWLLWLALTALSLWTALMATAMARFALHRSPAVVEFD